MRWPHLFNWLSSRAARRSKRIQTSRPRWRFALPRLERLEDRLAPAGVNLFQQYSNVNGAWQNGNLNANQARLLEGDSVPYRVQFKDLTPGATYVYTFGYETTNNGLKAFDYITSYDFTWNGGSGFGTSVDGRALNGTGLAASTPFTTFQIPTDPNINSGPPATS